MEPNTIHVVVDGQPADMTVIRGLVDDFLIEDTSGIPYILDTATGTVHEVTNLSVRGFCPDIIFLLATRERWS